MTNFEATAYARIALLNLIESKTEINPDTLFYEMHTLFDLYDAFNKDLLYMKITWIIIEILLHSIILNFRI